MKARGSMIWRDRIDLRSEARPCLMLFRVRKAQIRENTAAASGELLFAHALLLSAAKSCLVVRHTKPASVKSIGRESIRAISEIHCFNP